MKKLFTALFFLLSMGLFAQDPVVYHVDSAATGGNGLTWTEAFNDLQEALAVAVSGDTIKVAQGAYKPDGPGGDPAATFLIAVNLTLLGGYPTGGGAPDPEVYETILSGDLNGDDVPGDFVTNRGDNVMTVVRVPGGSEISLILDGFTIRNGQADGLASNFETKGGGLFCAGLNNVIIRNCRFLNHFAKEQGGAIHAQLNQIELEACVFEHNATDGLGAGLNMDNAAGTLTNCSFLENTATDGGGLRAACYIFTLLDPGDISIVVENCIFENNYATNWGGGAALFNWRDNTQISISNCTFTGNEAGEWGGGLRVSSLPSSFNPTAQNTSISVDQCTFDQNIGQKIGGGLFSEFYHIASSYSLTNCEFTGNHTDELGGGAVIVGGGPGEGMVEVENCSFQSNTAYVAGGISIGGQKINGSSLIDYAITNCHFQDNTAEVFAGGMELFSDYFNAPSPDTFLISGCSWINNTAGQVGGGIGITAANDGLIALISNSELHDNSSPFGSAVGADPSIYSIEGGSTAVASLRFENCLMTGNTSDTATVALRTTGNVELLNCTLADNSGGGLAVDSESVATLQNTLFANDGTKPELQPFAGDAQLTSKGGNLVVDASMNDFLNSLDKPETQPQFETIGDHTYYPAEASPQVNGGVNEGVTSEYDLDGNLRKKGFVDIGALESDYKVAVREVLAAEPLQVFPNPAQEKIFVEWPEGISGPIEIQLYDLQGRLLRQENLPIDRGLNVKSLPSGLFLLKATVNGKYFAAKFSKH
jgi:hypothetical protein